MHKIAMISCTALALLQGRAGANTVTVGAAPTVAPDGANFKWTYSASLFNGKIRVGEGLITIYDFEGFVPGTAFGPSGWAFSSSPSGTTPTDLGVIGTLYDDPTLPNLTWTYVNGPELASANTSTAVLLGSFGADSTKVDGDLDKYVTRDRSNPSDAAPDGALSGSFGSTDVPIDINRRLAIPDGGSSVMLLGLALVGLGGLARKFSAGAR